MERGEFGHGQVMLGQGTLTQVTLTKHVCVGSLYLVR